MQISVVEMVMGIVGSGAITHFVNYLLTRKQMNAGTVKLRNEAGQIVLEGELKVTEFYKKQLEAILEKYNLLEAKLDKEIQEHSQCRIQIDILEQKYNDLQRQFTLLKVKFGVEEP